MPRMAAADDLLQRVLDSLTKRMSGSVVAVTAFLLYGGLGLALPLLAHWSVSWLVAANVSATMLAGLLILVWLVVQVQAAHRRHLVEWTTDLRRLDSAEFEWLVGEVFHREGWTVAETGRRDGPDGNIDLRLTRAGQTFIVQCKRWSSWLVDVDEIRKFAGTLTRERPPSSAGIFVTLSDFTAQAREEATTLGLTLVDNRDLYARVERVRKKEPCPVCGEPMLLDRSGRGWWYRCLAPGCGGRRDLSNDPGRAVGFLIEPPSS